MVEVNEKAENGIHESLRELAFPVELLETLPGNPRRGDVQAVLKSYEVFGQRKPIVARMNPDGVRATVLAGNTQLKAAKTDGWSHIAVVFVDDDDKTAAAFAIADNRTHDLGEYDDALLLDMISEFRDDDALIDGSGYDLMEIMDMEEKIQSVASVVDDTDFDFDSIFDDGDKENKQDDLDEEDEPKPIPRPVIQYTIIFSTEEQQSLWFKFVKWLKNKYPEEDIFASRLTKFIETVDMG